MVISFVGSWFKILRMSWYTFMTLFWDNLLLVMKKYFCRLHDSFPGIDYNSNKEVLIGMSNYNYSHNHIDFFWIWLFINNFSDTCNLNELLYLITFNIWIWYKRIYRIFEKCPIWYMPDYTYGDYVYLNINIDAPKEHHNKSILN